MKLATFLLVLLAPLAPAQEVYIQVEVQDGPSLDIVLSPDEPTGFLQDEAGTWAQAKAWFYDGWSEVFISNSSIENPVGDYTAGYVIQVGDVEASRPAAWFQDGTGFVEFFGRPTLKPDLDLIDRYIGDAPVEEAVSVALNWNRLGLDGYPHEGFSPMHWSIVQFDPAPDRAVAGSPDNRGATTMEAAMLAALVRTGNEDAPAVERLTDHLFGFVGQQCRRPISYMHDESREVYVAEENPDVILGQQGPSNIWGHKNRWGRERVPTCMCSPWTGIENQHLTVDHLYTAYAFYGSQFALEQIMLTAEGIRTWPHFDDNKWVTESPRSWGWGFKVQTLALMAVPFTERRLRYWDTLQNLMETYTYTQTWVPISGVMPHPAAFPKVYPSIEGLAAWAEKYNQYWPSDQEWFQGIMANYEANPTPHKSRVFARDVMKWWANNGQLFTKIKAEQHWSYTDCWQLAVCARAISLLDRNVQGGVPQAKAIGIHILNSIIREGQGELTFHRSYAYNIPGLKGGPGQDGDKDGTAIWIAGGLMSLFYLIEDSANSNLVLDSIGTIYLNNNLLQPSDSQFWSWTPEGPALLGEWN